MFFVYLLISQRSTYVGATVDVDRRLRQHNGVIKGGARQTARVVAKGGKWERVCHVAGFPTWKCALQFEWKWKYLTRKMPKGKPLQRRMEALNELMSSERSTSTAIPFSEYTLTIIDH